MEPLKLTLAMPDHALTLNRARTNPGKRNRLVGESKAKAKEVGEAAAPPLARPWFPGNTQVLAVCRVERHARGNRWDYGGMVEALKPALDGLQGIVYGNDKQVVGMVILWDEKPTGTGVVRVTFKEWQEDDEDDQLRPVAGAATAE